MKKNLSRPEGWSYVKPKVDERRKFTLYVAGVMPDRFPERLDRLTGNYDAVTLMCAEGSGMEDIVRSWARSRRQACGIIPEKDLCTFPGFMQFMRTEGNRAVLAYDDGTNRKDVQFAEELGKEDEVQYRKVAVERPKDEASDFADAVAGISAPSGQMAR